MPKHITRAEEAAEEEAIRREIAGDDLADIRAEIIRMSGRLPWDDPLRIAIACAQPQIVSQGD